MDLIERGVLKALPLSIKPVNGLNIRFFMKNNFYLAELTVCLCKYYSTEISDIAWKRFKTDFREWFDLPVPYLQPEHKRYIRLLVNYFKYIFIVWDGAKYDQSEADYYTNRIKLEHPNYQELKQHGYV